MDALDFECFDAEPYRSSDLYRPGRGTFVMARSEAKHVLGAAIAEPAITEARWADCTLPAEAMLRALGTVSPNLLYATDRHGQLLYANPATLAVIGRPAVEVLGRTVAEWHFDPAQAEAVMASDQRIMAAGVTVVVDEAFTDARGGEVRLFESTKTPLREPDTGEIIGLVGISRDVTEERRAKAALVEAQAALREREEILRLFVERAPAAIAMFDTKMRYLAVSRRFVADRRFDLEPEAMLGRSHYDLFPDIPERWREVHRRVLAGETVSADGDPYPRADGSTDWIRWEMAPWHRTDGSIGGALLSSEVITARVEAERALAASEARFRATFEQAAVGIAHVGLDGRWLRVNARLCAILGYEPGELLARTFQDITHPEDLDADLAQVQALFAGRITTYSTEKRYLHANGSEVWANLTMSLARSEDGAPKKFIAVIDDISERRAVHAALREGEARLARAARMEALGRLAGGIAHDFNNVLYVVQTGIEVATSRLASDPDGAREYLSIVESVVERGAAITGRLLSFARQRDLKAEPIAPRTLLDSLAEMLRDVLGGRITLGVVTPSSLPDVLADRSQLEAVLVNLANNARDAMPDGGGIVLSAEAMSAREAARVLPALPGCDYIRFAVADEGEGMAPEVLARVSEPFYTTKPEGRGTGLGLATARAFVEQSGGGLTIESTPGKGTIVALWLPQVGVRGLSEAPTEPALRKVRAVGSPREFLLVDDQREIRIILAAGLADHGHAVTEAENAVAALAAIDGGLRPDALITDLMMPGCLDGLDLALTARARLPRLPVLLVTGHAADAMSGKLAMTAQGGPFAVVRKPASVESLVGRLQWLLRAPS